MHVSISGFFGSVSGATVFGGFAVAGLVVGALVGLLTSPVVGWIIREKERDLALILLYGSMAITFATLNGYAPPVHLGALMLAFGAGAFAIRRLMPSQLSARTCAQCGYPRRGGRATRCTECGMNWPEQLVHRRRRWLALWAILLVQPVTIWVVMWTMCGRTPC